MRQNNPNQLIKAPGEPCQALLTFALKEDANNERIHRWGVASNYSDGSRIILLTHPVKV